MSGFKSKLLRNPLTTDTAYITHDLPLIVDGRAIAVSLFHSFYFAHPTIAFRRSVLVNAGGYHDDPENVSDLITEARVLCRGNLAYDPRRGVIFTDHGENAPRTMDKKFKTLTYRNMYRVLVADMKGCGVGWPSILRADLQRYSDSELMSVFSDWARYGAPKDVQRIGWESIRSRQSLGGLKLLTKAPRKVGLRNLLRFGAAMVGR